MALEVVVHFDIVHVVDVLVFVRVCLRVFLRVCICIWVCVVNGSRGGEGGSMKVAENALGFSNDRLVPCRRHCHRSSTVGRSICRSSGSRS